MTLELNAHQTKLAIYAFEQMAFMRCKQTNEFQQRSLHLEAEELFSLAGKLRQAIGWPKIDDAINQGWVRKSNL